MKLCAAAEISINLHIRFTSRVMECACFSADEMQTLTFPTKMMSQYLSKKLQIISAYQPPQI